MRSDTEISEYIEDEPKGIGSEMNQVSTNQVTNSSIGNYRSDPASLGCLVASWGNGNPLYYTGLATCQTS